MSVTINFSYLVDTLKTELDACHFLQEHNVIPKSKYCKKQHPMKLCKSGSVIKWRCSKKTCQKKVSVKTGTWLENSRLTLKKLLLFIYCWSSDNNSIKFCIDELKINKNTTVDYNNFLREVCTFILSNEPRSIGGEDKTVEIDHILYTKRKNEGKMVPDQWVFGGICRETEEVFLFAVPDPTEDAITERIKNNIKSGTTIISKCEPPYKNIENIDGYHYKHLMVNNGKNVENPNTNIKKLDKIWTILDERSKKHCGINRKMLDSYLSEIVWKHRYANKDLFANILKDIATYHSSTVSLPSSPSNKPSNSTKEMCQKRKLKSSPESSKTKRSKTKNVKIVEISSSSCVKVVLGVSPSDPLQTPDDDKNNENLDNNEGTIANSLQSQEKPSDNILVQPVQDNERSFTDDDFVLFGKSVANRLISLPRDVASQLRHKIDELIKNFG